MIKEDVIKKYVEKFILEECNAGRLELCRINYLFMEEIIFQNDIKDFSEYYSYWVFEKFIETFEDEEEGMRYPMLARRGIVPHIDFYEDGHVEIVFTGISAVRYRETIEAAEKILNENMRIPLAEEGEVN